ncbi:tenascin-like isoform X5 [Gasterosteus aculeatus]
MGTQRALSCFLLAALLSSSDAGLVKKILRHRRQTPQPAEEHNLTLPSGERPVVFSHVYNINVPASSLCSVDLDAPESARLQTRDAGVPPDEHAAEHTVDGENQIVFTHRINVPRRACGCSEDLPGLKELMSRLEMLEGEVSALRDQCHGGGGGACCGAQVTGEVATKPYCHGHGNYSAETCGCVCEPGWKGPNCTRPECPGNCRKRGRCVDGSCVCDRPWTGSDCSELPCPKDCHGRGLCQNGTCRCDAGYAGEDCGGRTCANNCHGNGFCADGACVCAAGFSGDDCSRLTCLNGCSDRGACFNGVCICQPGYQGADCSQLACLNDCNGRGQCVNGRCACDVGFQGDDCAELSCPSDCLRRGRCLNGQCVCEEGFVGEDCGGRTCPSNCHGRGECVEGRCECRVGFAGLDCGELSCPGDCRSRGRCVDGQCVCDEGFSGEDCGRRACPNDCLARGRCVDGACVCRDGYSGDDCSALACPANCNGRGRCVDGRCACDSGHEGESCAPLSCLNGCRDKGRCESGRCVCDEGFIGDDCSGVSPPKDLTVGEVTPDTVELSWSNDMLVTEYLVTYVPTSPGGLHAEFTVSGDKAAATVKELEPGIEYQINVYAVLSNATSVPVGARVATELPKPQGVIFKPRESSVRVMWDQLDIPFDGWEIYFRNPKEENGEVVSTLPPSQNWFVQSGLGPGQEYEVSINIIKNDTRGPRTSKRVTTKIDGPRQLEVKDVTDSSALVVWFQPASPTDGLSMVYGPSADPSDKTRVDISPSDKQHSLGALRPDTEYKVSLVSRSGGLASAPAVATFTTALDAPLDLQSLSQTDDSVTLEWTNSQADVGGYLVKYSPISGASHGEELFPRGPGQTTRATITGLHPGTEYGIGVTATKNERQSLPATTNAATDIDPPTDLEGTESTETSLALSWQRPRARVGAYRLEYSSEDGRVGEAEIPGAATSYVLSDLTPGMSYTLTLSAERGLSRSAPVTVSASTASFTFYLADSDDRELPSPKGSEDNVVSFAHLDPSESQISVGTEPEDELTVSGVTPDGFDLTWTLKAHGVYDSLTVAYKDARPLRDAREAQLPGDAAGSRIRGLNASTEYQIKLYGITGSQRSALLEAVAVTAPEPTSPDVLMLSIEDATTAALAAAQSPDPPLLPNPPDSGVTGSGAEPESAGAVDVLGDHVNSLPGVGGLSPSTRYDVTVQGERSLVFPTTEEPRPLAVNLSTSDVTWDGFTASWLPAGGDFESFVIEVTNLENAEESRSLSLSGDARSLGLSGLRPHTGYLVGLYAMYRGSLLQPVYTQATTEAEPEVEHLFVSDVTADGFRLSWAADGDLFDRYVIRIRDAKRAARPREYAAGGAERTKVLTGLASGTEYEIELYGVSLDQRSQPVSGVAQTALSTPRGLRFSHVTGSSAVVHWSTPRSPVDNYRITYVPSEGGSPLSVTVDGDVFEALLPDMIPGKTYQVTVSAVKGLEESDPTTDNVITALDRPRGLSVANVTDTSALLLWQPSVATVDGYVITYSADSVSHVVEHVSGDTAAFQMGSLVPGTRYTVGVHATKESRRSDSAGTEFTTDVDPPRDVTAVNIGADSATLTWKPPQAAVSGYTLSFYPAGAAVREVVLSPTASSYVMAELTRSTEYSVRLQAIAGAQRSRHADAAFTTVGQLHRRPKDCAQVLLNGETSSGLHTVYVGGEQGPPVQVYCDMTTDGGGWMVFLRRQNGKLDFFRNWKNYTVGFGNMNDEFWLGLSNLHKITNSGHYELRVDLRDSGESAYAQYDRFTVAEPKTRYKVSVGSYSGTAGDSMSYHQGRPFSTYDNDNDIAVTNCALSYKGAFWYKNCHRVNLMGKYGDDSHSKGINWFHWKAHEHSIPFAEMKIRPADFGKFESRKKRS